MTAPQEAPTAQKSRSGFTRIAYAARYSLMGLRAGLHEAAFRLEVFLACFMLPAAFWVGRNWLEIAFLIATVVLVLTAELLNTGIEKAIDRMGPEWHAMSKAAKDMGSAAVFLTMLLCGGSWLAALHVRFF